jgi:predicted acylesterase/phospholipase RssA
VHNVRIFSQSCECREHVEKPLILQVVLQALPVSTARHLANSSDVIAGNASTDMVRGLPRGAQHAERALHTKLKKFSCPVEPFPFWAKITRHSASKTNAHSRASSPAVEAQFLAHQTFANSKVMGAACPMTSFHFQPLTMDVLFT